MLFGSFVHLYPLQGIAKSVAKALGKEANIVLYDPEATGTGKGGKADGFPFRCGRWALLLFEGG